MKRFIVEVSQNGWEYTGRVMIKCVDIVRAGENKVIADGIEIEFDEEIGSIEELLPKVKPYWDGFFD